MEKVIRDGKVAVLVSPGYGAGWSTWAPYDEIQERCLFDPLIVAWVEGGKKGPVPIDHLGDDYLYDGGASDLEIFWVPVGVKFRIHEYDGHERLILLSEEKYFTA